MKNVNDSIISEPPPAEAKSPDIQTEIFLLCIIAVFIAQTWFFVKNTSLVWIFIRIFYSLLSLLPIMLASTEWGTRILRKISGKKNIALKFCIFLTALIGAYVLFGRLSYEGFYLVMGLKISGKVYRYTPFAFIVLISIFFIISSVKNSVIPKRFVKANDVLVIMLLLACLFALDYRTVSENNFVALFNANIHPGIAAAVYFALFISYWLYVNMPLTIFVLQRNYNRLDLGLSFHLTKTDLKYLFGSVIIALGLLVLIGFVRDGVLYIPYDLLPLRIWFSKIYYAIFVYGITEEFIFRGLLLGITYRLFLERGWRHPGPYAICISSLLYGLSHWKQGVPDIVLMLSIGIVFGYTYHKTGKIAVPILANAFWKIVSSHWSSIL